MGHPLPPRNARRSQGYKLSRRERNRMVGNQVRSARISRPQPSSTTLLPVYGSAPTTPTTKGKADISEICQHMTQLEEAGCSLARVTTCRAHTGEQARFNYFSFTTPRFPCRAPAKAGLVRTGESRWREPKCVGGRARHQALLAQAQKQGWHRLSGCSNPRSRGAVAGAKTPRGKDRAGRGPATFVWGFPTHRDTECFMERSVTCFMFRTSSRSPAISHFPRARHSSWAHP